MFYFDRGKLWRSSTQIPQKHDENLHLKIAGVNSLTGSSQESKKPVVLTRWPQIIRSISFESSYSPT
jgi:hypothetical protein